MVVRLTKRRGTLLVDRARLLRQAQKLLRELGVSHRELSVLLTGDEEMTELNRVYRQQNKSTDVLSFSQLEGSDQPPTPLLGDVVISIPTAARQARQRGVDILEELLFLLVHGVLHLLGFEHVGVGQKRAAEMRREQARLMDTILGG